MKYGKLNLLELAIGVKIDGIIINGESTLIDVYEKPQIEISLFLNSGDVIEIPHKWNSSSSNSNDVDSFPSFVSQNQTNESKTHYNHRPSTMLFFY